MQGAKEGVIQGQPILEGVKHALTVGGCEREAVVLVELEAVPGRPGEIHPVHSFWHDVLAEEDRTIRLTCYVDDGVEGGREPKERQIVTAQDLLDQLEDAERDTHGLPFWLRMVVSFYSEVDFCPILKLVVDPRGGALVLRGKCREVA